MALSDHQLFVGEARLAGLSLTRTVENTALKIEPDSATLTAVHSVVGTVIDEQACGVSGTTVYYLISEADVTQSAGSVELTWTVVYGSEIVKKQQTVTVEAE